MSIEQSGSRDREPGGTHNRGNLVIHVKGQVDRTRRPRRPNIPRFWPEGIPFPSHKTPEQPPPPEQT